MSLMSINSHFFFSQCSVSQRNGRNTCQDLQQIESFENSVSVDFYMGKKTYLYLCFHYQNMVNLCFNSLISFEFFLKVSGKQQD